MANIYRLSDKIQRTLGFRLSSIFLVINILFWSGLALSLSVAASLVLVGSLKGCGITIFCITGYTGLIIGFLGGYFYLDRRK